MVGLCLLLIALLVHIGWTFSLAFRSHGRQDQTTEQENEGQRLNLSRDLRQRALALASKGDYRESTRVLFLALLALFEEKKLLHVAKSWTPREIIEKLPKSVGNSDELGWFRQRFEQAYYGEQELTAEHVRRLDSILDTATEHAGRPS